MTLGEDLLLLAIAPRSGRVRRADRLKFVLRASVLLDLALAQRITMNANRIKVLDPAPTGDPRLDHALALLGESKAPSLHNWLDETPPGYAIVNTYLGLLADQGAVRRDRRPPGRTGAPDLVALLDKDRRDRVKARLDRAGRDASQDADLALAGLVHACGLDRWLYRCSPAARRRIARLSHRNQHVDNVVAEAASAGIEQMSGQVAKTVRDDYLYLNSMYGGGAEHYGDVGHRTGYDGGGHHHGGFDGGGHHHG